MYATLSLIHVSEGKFYLKGIGKIDTCNQEGLLQFSIPAKGDVRITRQSVCNYGAKMRKFYDLLCATEGVEFYLRIHSNGFVLESSQVDEVEKITDILSSALIKSFGFIHVMPGRELKSYSKSFLCV